MFVGFSTASLCLLEVDSKLAYKYFIASWIIFRSKILMISLIVLPIITPFIFLFTILFYNTNNEELSIIYDKLYFAIEIIIYPIYGAATIYFLSDMVTGEKFQVVKAWKLGFKFWGKLFLLTIITLFAVFTGLVALIIPGIYAFVKLSFAGFELLLNNKTVTNSLRTSWNETKGLFWLLFNGYLIITVYLALPAIVFNYILSQTEGPISIAVYVFDEIFFGVFSTLYVVYAFKVYVSETSKT